jgi:hypothetical protein
VTEKHKLTVASTRGYVSMGNLEILGCGNTEDMENVELFFLAFIST